MVSEKAQPLVTTGQGALQDQKGRFLLAQDMGHPMFNYFKWQ